MATVYASLFHLLSWMRSPGLTSINKGAQRLLRWRQENSFQEHMIDTLRSSQDYLPGDGWDSGARAVLT